MNTIQTPTIKVPVHQDEVNQSSLCDMTDEEIIQYVSNENNNPTLEEIKYILDRGTGDINYDNGRNDDLCELFENERQTYDGIRYAFELCPDFAKYLFRKYM